MPTRAIACRCGGRVIAGRCDRCNRLRAARWETGQNQAARKSAAARGYDAKWRALRLRKLAADPLCECCIRSGRVYPAVDVHHKRKFRRPDGSVDDSLRLSWPNLESVCKACHAAYTRAGL